MRLVPLNEIVGYSDKEPLPMVRGKILAVKKQMSGQSSHGPWTMQDVEIEGDGCRMTVSLCNKEPLSGTNVGQVAEFSCHEGEKGLSGVYAQDYKGVRKIKVTQTGNIALLTGAAPPGVRPAPPRQEPARQVQAPPPQDEDRLPMDDDIPYDDAPDPKAKTATNNEIAEVKKSITQCANLMLLCHLCVEKVIVPEFKLATGKDMDEARKSALGTSLYISMERKGANTVMPRHPLTKDEQTAW